MPANLLLHEDARQLSALEGGNIRRTGVEGLLTSAQVVAATTAEDLVTDIETNQASGLVHEETYQDSLQSIKAIRVGAALGDQSDAKIQAATSVPDLVANTFAADETDQTHIGPEMTE